MVIEHNHGRGMFDAGHCWTCGRENGLIPHYWRVQREEDTLWAAQRWARRARGFAVWALCSSGSASR